MRHEAELAFAHRLADAADAITLGRFRALDLAVETKPDLTPVSEADRSAEHAIRELIARERPGESVFDDPARFSPVVAVLLAEHAVAGRVLREVVA